MKLRDLFKRKPKLKWVEEWPVPYKEDWALEELHLRDPFIIVVGERYYLTGTLSHENISDGYGVPLYESCDLKTWAGPKLIVEQAKGFSNYSCFWAPEIHKVDNEFWLFVTLEPKGGKRGTYLLKSEQIDGEYAFVGRVTPEDMFSLDGTLYEENGEKYVVYCYEWVEAHDGHIRAVKLLDGGKGIDLSSDRLLFKASANVFYPRANPNKITDGPFMYKDEGKLKMLWSTVGSNKAYMLISATSKGGLFDEWVQDVLVYDEDGGHGMIFNTLEGERKILIHAPNGRNAEKGFFEHPVILPFCEHKKHI